MNWVVVCIALTGLILNAKGKWQGFLCWLISNAWWCRYNIIIGEYSQAVLFGLFWLSTIYGIWYWRKKRKKTKEAKAIENKRMELLLHQNTLQRRRITNLSHGLFGKNKKKSRRPST